MIVKFGALEELLSKLRYEPKVVSESLHAIDDQVSEDILRGQLTEACSNLSIAAIVFLRCFVRSVLDDIALNSISSGILFFLDKPPSFREQLLNEWIRSTSRKALLACIPILSNHEMQSVLKTIDSSSQSDLYCFARFRLALILSTALNRSIATADLAFACVSSLSSEEKLASISTLEPLTDWEGYRRVGFPFWNRSDIRPQIASLSRQYHSLLNDCLPEDRHRVRTMLQWTLFWAVVQGCSPKAVLAWKRDFYWKDNQKLIDLLNSDWSQQSVRDDATRAAINHRSSSEFLFAAVIFIWLGDNMTACRDCLYRGMGDWQLAILTVELRGKLEEIKKFYDMLWDERVVARNDPWLGVVLCLKYQSKGLHAPLTITQVLSGQFLAQSPLVDNLQISGPASTPPTSGLQELELIMSRKGMLSSPPLH